MEGLPLTLLILRGLSIDSHLGKGLQRLWKGLPLTVLILGEGNPNPSKVFADPYHVDC